MLREQWRKEKAKHQRNNNKLDSTEIKNNKKTPWRTENASYRVEEIFVKIQKGTVPGLCNILLQLNKKRQKTQKKTGQNLEEELDKRAFRWPININKEWLNDILHQEN